MPDKGTVVPLPPTAKRLEEAKALETPQSFVPGTSVSAGQSWQAAGPARKMMPVGVVGALGGTQLAARGGVALLPRALPDRVPRLRALPSRVRVLGVGRREPMQAAVE